MTIASSLIASAHTKPWPGTGPQTFTAAWPIQPSASPRRQRKRHLHTRLAHSQHLHLRQHRRSGASHRKTNLPHHQAGQISICSSYVELRGFEPLTSSMPWKRATNCAIAPRAVPDYRMLSPVGKAALAACFRAVAMVSMAASSWATERNHASKAEGGNATPPSSIAWKNRP